MNIVSEGEGLNKLFGVYLLMSQNVKYKGRVYIGFTMNPQRRMKQHNRGKNYGGAKKTSGKGPWLVKLGKEKNSIGNNHTLLITKIPVVLTNFLLIFYKRSFCSAFNS